MRYKKGEKRHKWSDKTVDQTVDKTVDTTVESRYVSMPRGVLKHVAQSLIETRQKNSSGHARGKRRLMGPSGYDEEFAMENPGSHRAINR